MAGFELIDAYDTLNVGRIAINGMYSGMTIYWSGSTGTDSLIRNNNAQTLKNRASGTGSLAGGIANSANGSFGMAFWGSGNTAHTAYSVVINGRKNSISDTTSISSTIINGSGNTIAGQFSTIINGVSNLIENSNHSAILGGYHNRLEGESDFMTILGGSGNTIDGTSGLGKHAIIVGGYTNTIGNGGASVVASGILAGFTNSVLAEYGAVIGGIGNSARALGSVAMGGGSQTSVLFGFSIGGTNTTTSSPANNTITLNGTTGQGSAEGGFITGPADIAEMFQYADNNPLGEDRKGLFVSMVSGGTIAVGNTNIIGVISVTPGYVGDSAELKWSGIYLKDIWGKKIMDTYKFFTWINRKGQNIRVFQNEEGVQYSEYPHPSFPIGKIYDGDSIPENAKMELIEVPRLNPEYDSETPYIPRSQRKEWAPVGLLGKLLVRTAEEITGTHVDANANGMAVNGTKYPVIKHIKAYESPYGIVQIFLK